MYLTFSCTCTSNLPACSSLLLLLLLLLFLPLILQAMRSPQNTQVSVRSCLKLVYCRPDECQLADCESGQSCVCVCGGGGGGGGGLVWINVMLGGGALVFGPQATSLQVLLYAIKVKKLVLHCIPSPHHWSEETQA